MGFSGTGSSEQSSSSSSSEEKKNDDEKARDKDSLQDSESGKGGTNPQTESGNHTQDSLIQGKGKVSFDNRVQKEKATNLMRKAPVKVYVKIPKDIKDKQEYKKSVAKREANRLHRPVEVNEDVGQPAAGGAGSNLGGLNIQQLSDFLQNPQGTQAQAAQPSPSATPPVSPILDNPTYYEGGTNPTPPQQDPSRINADRLRDLGKIKPPENIGRYVAPGSFALANEIVDKIGGVDRFTSWNHGKHTAGSLHYRGLAFDIRPLDRTNAGYARLTASINKLLADNGLQGRALDENAHPSSASSGPHVHVELSNEDAARKAAQLFGGQGTGTVPGGQPGGTEGGTPGGTGGTGDRTDNGTNNGNNGPFDPNTVGVGAVTMADRVALARAAGFSPDQATTMGAISQAESSGNSRAYNPRGRDDSYGLWQINMIGNLGIERDALFRRLIPGYTGRNDLFNPWKNAQAARIVYNREGFGAWSTYGGGRGSFTRYLSNAQNGIGAGSSTAGVSASRGAAQAGGTYRGPAGTGGPATGKYPPTARNLTVNTSNNPFAGGRPAEVTLQLGQFIQQAVGLVGLFSTFQTFTNPPPNIENIAPYRNGLVLDFKITNPTIPRSIEAFNIVKNFLDTRRVGSYIENFYLTADPIESGYIHVELNPDSVGQASYVLNLISNYNAGIVELEGDNSLLPPP